LPAKRAAFGFDPNAAEYVILRPKKRASVHSRYARQTRHVCRDCMYYVKWHTVSAQNTPTTNARRCIIATHNSAHIAYSCIYSSNSMAASLVATPDFIRLQLRPSRPGLIGRSAANDSSAFRKSRRWVSLQLMHDAGSPNGNGNGNAFNQRCGAQWLSRAPTAAPVPSEAAHPISFRGVGWGRTAPSVLGVQCRCTNALRVRAGQRRARRQT